METDKKTIVSVMSFNSVMEAQLYKALLESAGIPARMQNDIAAQMLPVYGALMQVNLLVAEEDQAKARQILGAKFDIDEFNRQVDESQPEDGKKKPAGKKASRKTSVKKSETKSVAKKPAPVSKKADPKGASKKPAAIGAKDMKAATKTTVKSAGKAPAKAVKPALVSKKAAAAKPTTKPAAPKTATVKPTAKKSAAKK